MANLFFDLPLPALNGAGAGVDVSTQSGPKTVSCVGAFPGATITIEASNDGGLTYSPVTTFQNMGGQRVIPIAAEFMRVNVSGRKVVVPFAANIDVGAPDAGALFAIVPMPALNGAGAAVDLTAFGVFTTFVCTGAFAGAVILVEISEDGAAWAPLVQFSGQGGVISRIVTANFVRANVSGRNGIVPFSGGLSVGAYEMGGGGIGGIDVEDEGVPLAGGPFTTLDFVGDGVTAADAGGGVATITIPGGGSAYSPPEQWAQNDVAANQAAVAMSAQVSTSFDDIKMQRDGSVVGLATRLTEAVTAGTATVEVTINGVATALSIAHTAGGNPSGGIATAAPGVVSYVAGDLIGMVITTDAGFLPITTDIEAWILVEDD